MWGNVKTIYCGKVIFGVHLLKEVVKGSTQNVKFSHDLLNIITRIVLSTRWILAMDVKNQDALIFLKINNKKKLL